LIPEVKDVVSIKCGNNHVLALTKKGEVYTWGAGEQSQVGRRVVDRETDEKDDTEGRKAGSRHGPLHPYLMFGIGARKPKIVTIGCGDYTSYAVAADGKFYSWGLNSSGQTGHALTTDLEGCVVSTAPVKNLKDYKVTQVQGGANHTIALTDDGHVLVWGSCKWGQAGMLLDDIPTDAAGRDDHDDIAYIKKPIRVSKGKAFHNLYHYFPTNMATVYEGDEEELDEELVGACIACGPDTNLVISRDGKAYSWGFSENWNTGLGKSTEILQATWMDNTAVRGKKLIYGGCGGQFGVAGAEP
jgi:regulator of chromosome condensation